MHWYDAIDEESQQLQPVQLYIDMRICVYIF